MSFVDLDINLCVSGLRQEKRNEGVGHTEGARASKALHKPVSTSVSHGPRQT